jgi:glycosyltransferase involved in cell wall biosynthesis
MSKINVLCIPSDRSGVGKFRSVEPHVFLQQKYPEDFFVEIDYQPPFDNLDFYKKYQIVHFHRSISPNFEASYELVGKLNKMGIITICDIDDYWAPTKDHPIHDIIMYHKINEKIVESLRGAQYITTTTKVFADEIKKINKNVIVFPNAINPQEPQFKEITEESDKVRIGWLGGSSHIADLKLLDKSFNKLIHLKDKTQYVLCGFDTRGTITEINSATGEQNQRPIKPEESVWARYEEIFTQNYKTISDEFKSKLMKFEQLDYPEFADQPYRRVWTLPVTSYAKNYSKFDFSLAPIKNHMFNRMKSQLKVIEAGFYKKAIVASKIGPYTIDLKHCLDKGQFINGNAMLVDEFDNVHGWAKYLEKLIKNPNLVKDMGERLYETVKDQYDLNNVTKERAEFYKSLIK